MNAEIQKAEGKLRAIKLGKAYLQTELRNRARAKIETQQRLLLKYQFLPWVKGFFAKQPRDKNGMP